MNLSMPERRYTNGTLGFSLHILFSLLLLSVLTGQAFAVNCTASYTYTSNGGSSNYNLNAGQSLKLTSGTYTGTLDNFASNATVCVESGATFQPNNMNNVAGTLVNYGTTKLATFSYNSGTVIDNYGTLNFTGGLNTNGATTFYNRANATMTMANSFQLGNNSTFINDGLVSAAQDFNAQQGTILTNNYRLEAKGNFNPDGIFTNNGRVYAEKFINMNSNLNVTNNCLLVSFDGFNTNNPNVTNNGTILVTKPGSKWQHNAPGTFHNGANAKVAGHDFTNSSTITGSGAFIFSGSTTNQGTFAGNSSTDTINFYDETQTGSQIFDFQNTTPTNTVRTAIPRPTELDAPNACASPYKSFSQGCPINSFAMNQTGNASSASTSGTVSNATRAVGTLGNSGSTATSTNAASVGSSGQLSLDLGTVIPANSPLIISLAPDTSTSRVRIETSLNGSTYTSAGTFGASGTLGTSTLDQLKRITLTVPASGIRYVRFVREASTNWIDGVEYSQVCQTVSYDYGDAPASYGDVSHTIVTGIKLGTNAPDSESASQHTHNATGDGDDEDGAPKSPSNSSITLFPLLKMTDTSYSSTFAVTNTTGTAGKLYGWIDFDKSGTFEADEATSVNAPTGTNGGTVTLAWNSIPTDIQPGTTFIRLRLTTDAAVTTSTPTGSANNGEVEDYTIGIALALPPNSPNVGVSRGTSPAACTTTVFSDNFNDLTGGQYFAANRPGSSAIRNWIASGGGTDTRVRTDGMYASTHGTSIYMDSGAIRRIFPTTATTPVADANGLITSPPTAIELRDIADDQTPGVVAGDSHWGPQPPRLSRTLNTIAGQRYRLYFELLPENNGNEWRRGILRVDTPSGSVHLQTPSSTDSTYQYQVDFTANATSSTISFVNYSRISVDGNWCIPASDAWCTIGGLSAAPKTSEPVIDNVTVALESACLPITNQDYGDAPASYGNPSHTITPNLAIGNNIDADNGTQQNANADADDTNGSPDDEDGLQNPAIIPTTVGQTYTLTTYVKNESGSTAYLTAYIDFNRDGDFSDPGERADTQHVYWNGSFHSTFTIPAGTTAGTTYARLRLSQTKAEAESPIGAATSGEVEDHKLTISSGPFYDFGDAPASYGNPRHTIVNSIFLGTNRPDSETGSQHSYNASGDGVDEDGAPKQYGNANITLFPILKMTATSYSVDIKTTNTTGAAGKLYGWIDFDKNGAFDADEAASVNVANNTNGTVTLTWNSIPTDIKLGTTFIRLRLTTDSAVSTSTPANNANDGEVEDFPIAVAIDVPPDSPDVTIVRGEEQTCSSTIFTDNFDDLASEQYFGANTSATPFVIRNWTATGGGSDTYARTVEVAPFAATQGRSVYFGNGMMRRYYPHTGGVLAFDGNGRMLEPPDAVELRDDPDDVTPGVNTHESDWGPEPVTLSRTFASTAGQRYRLYFSAIPEGGEWKSGMMRVDTPSGSVHFKAPAQSEGIQKYRIEFTATGASSTIRFVNYGHIGTDGGWCDPNSVVSGAWCTVGGFPVDKKGNELIIDDVAVALASACPSSGIAGSVYTDSNGNNTFDTGTESGLANITVTLYDNNGTPTNANDDNLITSTSSNASGAYSFTNISPALRYRVEVDARDTDLPASAVIGTANPLAGVSVAAGSTLSNQNFGFDLGCNASAGQFGGIAFRDYNQNGIRESQEEGIAGITVTAYNSANAVAATATTDARGWYTLSGLSNGTQYRLEYTNLPTGLSSGAVGVDNATTVRFVTASGNCTTHLGLSDPIEYCEIDPSVAAFNFVNGDPSVAAVGNYASLFTFPYNATGDVYNQTPAPVTKANTNQTGALWGMAYQKTTRTLFASAAMRRFAGFGTLGTGGIYKVDMTDPNAAYTGATPYVNLRTIGIDTGNDVRVTGDSCNNLASGPWSPSRDVAAWDKVGKVGVGDIDYDERNNRLWLVNLNDRKLYGINNVSPTTTPTAGNVLGGYAINLPSPYTCTSGIFRPWAVKYHRGYVYVGGVCDAASDPYNLSKVRGYVLRFDPANTAAGFSHVKDFPINQPRSGYGYNASEWSGWLPQADAVNVRPQFHSPIVGNLEFDTDGSIIVGIIDRAGLQKGTNAYDEPVCADPTQDYSDTMGDVLRLCKTDTGYLNDGELGCTTAIPNNSKTTDEYYWGDLGPSNNAWEGMNDIAAGGLALAPGKEHVLASAYDANSWGTNGVVWLNNRTGAKDNAYSLSWTTLGKSTGMGELEVLCDPAPIEVGNRVWLDTDKDGIQDAGEPGISNVNVTLTCGADSASTTTNANGEYYFSNASGKNATFMGSGENCSLSINNSQASLSSYTLTIQNADGNTSNDGQRDLRDSDAAISGSNAIISFTVGSAGQNNHSLDFGYKPNSTPGTITGTVYRDTNLNNVFDSATETGIANITVSLHDENFTPANTADDTLVNTISTNASGAYTFSNVDSSRTYRIGVDAADIDLPASMTIGTTNPLTSKVVTAGGTLANQNFGFDLSSIIIHTPPAYNVCTSTSVEQLDAFQYATATGSGALGIPSLTYTAPYGSNRMMVVLLSVERDHTPIADGRGDNFEGNTPFSNSWNDAPTVTFGGVPLTKQSFYWDTFGSSTNVGDAEISRSYYLYVLFDLSIPTGAQALQVTGINAPKNAGDDAVLAVATFANVAGIEVAGGVNDRQSPFNIAISVAPTADGEQPPGTTVTDNLIFAYGSSSKPESLAIGAGWTKLAEIPVSNNAGSYLSDPARSQGAYTENDGHTLLIQSIKGVSANQTAQLTSSTNNLSGLGMNLYRFVAHGCDYGDAPASYGDAYHSQSWSRRIGTQRGDAETATPTAANASGDDANKLDDEDGVIIPALTTGQSGTVIVNVAGAAYLSAWIDWNGDGDFADAGEQIATDLQDTDADGVISIPVNVPATATTSQTYARFRWAINPGVAASGFGAYGEVEDYALTIQTGETASISGKIFEDVNYGGGAGRALGTAGTAGVNGSRVELYSSAGAFLTSTTTAADGSYSFSSLAAGNYYVRVVNDTVKSTRAGSNGTERGIQTYRTDGTTAITSEVGGRKPASVDAAANTTNQTLNTTTFVLSGGGQAQSVQAIALSNSSVTAADFGFNFSTIVNANDSGQGSLRQFILNSNLLGGEATLAQTGRTAGKENAIFELPTSDPKFNAANQYWSIAAATAMPEIGDAVIIDASTQPARAGFAFANRPVIELDGTIVKNLNQWHNGLILAGTNGGSTIKYLAINRFQGAGIKIRSSKNNTVSFNYIGTDPLHSATNIGNAHGIEIVSSADLNLINDNLIAHNGGDGIHAWNFNGGGTAKAAIISQNSIYANGGLGINLEAGNTNGSITTNDANDADTGANSLLNFPIFSQASLFGSNLTLKGCAPTGATVELFEADVSAGGTATSGANKFSKSKDYGEGQSYLTSFVEGSASDTDSANCTLPTDADGNNQTGMKAFSVTIPAPPGFVIGDTMTATATVSGVGTSEFSPVINTLTVNPPLGCSVLDAFDSASVQTIELTTASPGPITQTWNANVDALIGDTRTVTFGPAPRGTATNGYGLLDVANNASTAANMKLCYNANGAGLNVNLSQTDNILFNVMEDEHHNPNAATRANIPMTITLSDGTNSASLTQDMVNLVYQQLGTVDGWTNIRFPLVSFTGMSSLNRTHIQSICIDVAGKNGHDYAFEKVVLEDTDTCKEVSGKVFEDVNYGGGAGRAFGATGTQGTSGATLELYDNSGRLLESATSNGTGDYAFAGLTPNNYHVRAVSNSVKSTRSGSNGSERGIMTYRTDGTTATINSVGGYQPSNADADSNGWRESILNTGTFVFSGSTLDSKQAQVVQPITVAATNLSNVSFGFNFDTVTNTNDSGAGSLRQFLINANVLGGDATLAQVGRTAGKENAILELFSSDPNYTTGYWSIPLQSALPSITAPIVLDASLPPGSNSNPILELKGTTAGSGANGLTLGAGSNASTIRKLAITGFAGSGIYIDSSNNNSLLANHIGITPSGITRANTGSGIRINAASSNNIGGINDGEGNLITNNGGSGISITNSGSMFNSILGNSIYANAGLGIDLVGGTENSFGVTANDAGDTDSGPNSLINYPEVKVNSFGANGTKIVTHDFNLDLAAGDYRLEFFVSTAKDASGNGEGQTFIGSKDLNHPGTGNLNFKGTLNAKIAVAKGAYISATLTQKTGPTTYGSTSEFSGIRDGITTQVCDSLIDDTTSGSNMVIDETDLTTVIKLLEAKDSNGNPITYVISGGADGKFFTITNPAPGATLDCATVKFLVSNIIITKSALADNEAETRAIVTPGILPLPGNYELPMDKDKDNVYDLQITATTVDGKKYVRDMNVRVMDTNEAPNITSATALTLTEDSNAEVLSVKAQDPDANDKLSYRISGGADSSHFEINATTGLLRFRAIPDYDAPMDTNRDNLYEVEVTVTDKGGLTNSKLFKISIVNNTADDGVVVNVRALLQGAYDSNTALMSAELNTLGLLPNKQPYQYAPFNHAGTETLSTMLKETTGNNAVVDWALVDLRTSVNTIVASRAVMLQRDGDLVDSQTGSTNLHFANIKAGNYYISVRHRNHLGVMSASPVSLDNNAKLINFAASSTAVRGEETRALNGKVALMWAGDINGSNTLTANGPGNDVTSLLSGVITSTDNLQGNTNHILSGYLATDLNFDGKTLFTGPGNDTSLLVGNILLHPLNTGFAANYIVRGGLQ